MVLKDYSKLGIRKNESKNATAFNQTVTSKPKDTTSNKGRQ